MVRTVFDSFHPAVAAAYLVAVLALTMAAFHPLFLVPSLLVGVAYGAYLRGVAAALKTLAWQLPLLVVVALLNPVFSQSGSTVLFVWGQAHAYYLESLCYGACMGTLLLAVMTWFANLSCVLTSEKLLQLTGNVAPVLGLVVTMVLRLVPQFVRRGASIGAVQAAATAAARPRNARAAQPGDHELAGEVDAADSAPVQAAGTAAAQGPAGWRAGGNAFGRKAAQLQASFRSISVLMGWGMEDSLDTAIAMRARGWGAAVRRTTYRRSCFCLADGVALGVVLALAALSAGCAAFACSCFDFYPQLTQPNVLWWGYYPFLALLLVPVALDVRERAIWKA